MLDKPWILAVFAIFIGIMVFSTQYPQGGPSAAAVFDDCTNCLTIYNWEEYIDINLLKEFEERYNIQIKLIEYGTQKEFLDNFLLNPSLADIVIVDDATLTKLIDSKAVGPIDQGQLTNFKNLDSTFTDLHFDAGNVYSVPYQWGTAGLACNTKFIHAPDGPTWDLLWEYGGQAALLDDGRDGSSVPLQKLGYSTNTNNKLEIKQAQDELALADVELLSTLDIMTELINNELVVAQVYNGDAYAASLANPNIVFSIPEEGGIFWIDNFAISSESLKRAHGHSLINFFLEAQTSAQNSENTKFASPLKRDLLKPHINPELLGNAIIYPTSEELERLEFIKPVENEDLHRSIISYYELSQVSGNFITS